MHLLQRTEDGKGNLTASIQRNLSLVDTNGTYHCIQYTVEPSLVDTNGTYHCVQYTEEPLFSGHQWDLSLCPVYRGTSL